jgi:hypothetical protein
VEKYFPGDLLIHKKFSRYKTTEKVVAKMGPRAEGAG